MSKLVTKEMRAIWKPMIESTESDETHALSKSDILCRVLENTKDFCKNNPVHMQMDGASLNESDTAGNVKAGMASWSPVLIKMVKRLMPNLVAVDFMGTQPLSTPDGLIFAMRARYGGQTVGNNEAFYQQIQSGFSGNGVADAGDISGFPAATLTAAGLTVPAPVDPTFGQAAVTAQFENMGDGTTGPNGVKNWAQMGVTIEKQTVTAATRGLFADYSQELRQDMMALYGEDVDSILSDMLVTEIQAEMNREFIRTMNVAAKPGSQAAAVPGVYNLKVDADGRWFLERIKSFMFNLECDANAVAVDSRRGKANRLLCSPNVASALAMAGLLDYNLSNLNQNKDLEVDPTGQTFAGVLANGMKVFVDPYAVLDYVTMGYKGPTELDAGIFFAPYTPLEMYRTLDPNTFNPRMAFKTRYAIAANPFYAQNAAGVASAGLGLGQGTNGFFRKSLVLNLLT